MMYLIRLNRIFADNDAIAKLREYVEDGNLDNLSKFQFYKQDFINACYNETPANVQSNFYLHIFPLLNAEGEALPENRDYLNAVFAGFEEAVGMKPHNPNEGIVIPASRMTAAPVLDALTVNSSKIEVRLAGIVQITNAAGAIEIVS